ncbi:response regulator transcription factor [Dictyobacter arantiisoli]|uniref:DNA-binding response regulator n=1 Tax=Dictyobacter arantiisoli TaxID=2014874 RepID=A0A5A5TCD6_9CHLR|nr:response regulator transcription factor [Dictyobacter arantiisoli]GCF08679.1 DNA-binding response regulator [Dictyobacter arantiisoli]
MTARKQHILTADDDPQLLRLVSRSLELDDFDVLTATNGEEALAIIESQALDLILLDVMMPKMDGFTVCQKVREFSSVPIIIITARGQDDEKVKGLNLGADDYLTKPFNIDELVARVRAVLRRTQFTSQELTHATRTVTTIGNLTIDYAQRLVTVNGKEIVLTPTEYRVLAYLVQNAGCVVTQDLLLAYIWGQEYVGEGHMLQVNVNRLRRKIEPDPAHPRYILTKVGIGYQFSTKPKE